MTFDIVRPNPRFLEAYYETCRLSWGKVHDNYILHDPAKFQEWKGTIFTNYWDQENGTALPPGFVPSVTFWLIRTSATESVECLGVLNIRLRLTDALRRYGGNAGFFVRPDRRRCGIAAEIIRRLPSLFRTCHVTDEILLTCFAENTPSVKMLETIPGARLERDVIEIDGKNVPVLRAYLPSGTEKS